MSRWAVGALLKRWCAPTRGWGSKAQSSPDPTAEVQTAWHWFALTVVLPSIKCVHLCIEFLVCVVTPNVPENLANLAWTRVDSKVWKSVCLPSPMASDGPLPGEGPAQGLHPSILFVSQTSAFCR